MPNWCNNNIDIVGPTETVKQLWEDATAEGSGLLEAMAPMPKELEDTVADGSEGVNWYNWRVSNWGTKWDIDMEGLEFTDNGDGTASITGWFDTAWAPPIAAFETLSQDWDSCYIELFYEESGMCFVGCWDSEGGDDYYEYSDCDSKTISDVVPKYLVDQFALDERLSEYEEEEMAD